MIVALLFFASMWWVGFETGVNRADQAGIDMTSRIKTLNAEVKHLSDTLEGAEQALVASELQRTTLKERLEVLAPQLAEYRATIQTLEDQQLYYENLLSTAEAGSEVVGESAEVIQGPNGEWQFWVLITQSSVQRRSTKGIMRLTYEYVGQGADASIRLEEVVDEVPFEFLYFKRFEGNAPLPPGVVVQSARISVEINGKVVANQAFTSLDA